MKTQRFNLYYTDKMGIETLLRSDMDEDTLDQVVTAFELTHESDYTSALRVEETGQPETRISA